MANDVCSSIQASNGETRSIKDAQARSDISNLQSSKVDKESGKGLSTNDYTTEEKTKLTGIEKKANVNNVWFCIVQSVEVIRSESDGSISYVDFYMTSNRVERDMDPPYYQRFQNGDIFIVFFNGVDASQYRSAYPFLTRFYINETPSQTSLKHPYNVKISDSMTYACLSYWNAYSIRTFVYKEVYDSSGMVLQHSLTMAWASANSGAYNSFGEVTLSDRLDNASDYVAATAGAVKRLKDLIDTMGGGGLTYEVVQALPVPPNISTQTMYLVPKQTPGTQDVYDEYLNPTGLSGGWEHIGTTEIDLSNYYTKTETDGLLDDKVDKVQGKGLSTEDYTTAEKTKLSGIAVGAEVNVQPDWNQSDNTADDYIKNKPTIPAAQVNSDWNASSGVARILNKPSLANVATSGDADDVAYDNSSSGMVATNVQDAVDSLKREVSGKAESYDPVLSGALSMHRRDNTTIGSESATLNVQCEASGVQSFASGIHSTASGDYSRAEGYYSVASGEASHAENRGAVASGDYSHCEGKDTVAAGECQHVSGKYNIVDNNDDYAEIIGNGTADNARSNARELDWNGNEYLAGDLTINKGTANEMIVGQVLASKADTSSLDTVASSGDYDDLTNKPTIPAAQVNSDWNASSGVEKILNKPSLATVATSGSYSDLSNKPTIPTVNNAKLTIQQNGTTVKTFTANASSDVTANITTPDGSYKMTDVTYSSTLASGMSWKELTRFQLSGKGLWLIDTAINYPQNATGLRGVGIKLDTSNSAVTAVEGNLYQTTVGSGTGSAGANVTNVALYNSTNDTFYVHILGRQNSGSGMDNVAVRARAVRLIH